MDASCLDGTSHHAVSRTDHADSADDSAPPVTESSSAPQSPRAGYSPLTVAGSSAPRSHDDDSAPPVADSAPQSHGADSAPRESYAAGESRQGLRPRDAAWRRFWQQQQYERCLGAQRRDEDDSGGFRVGGGGAGAGIGQLWTAGEAAAIREAATVTAAERSRVDEE